MKAAVVEHLYCCSCYIMLLLLDCLQQECFFYYYYCTSTPSKQRFCNHAVASHCIKILEWLMSGLSGLRPNIWPHLRNLWSKPNQRLAIFALQHKLRYIPLVITSPSQFPPPLRRARPFNFIWYSRVDLHTHTQGGHRLHNAASNVMS